MFLSERIRCVVKEKQTNSLRNSGIGGGMWNQAFINQIDQLCKMADELQKIAPMRPEQLPRMLSDMQETAIRIGTEIEKLEVRGSKAVHLLEESCELFWQCSIADTKEMEGICNQIRKVLQNVLKEIQTMNEKKEIVFFPYKASMWDSLESVWSAAVKRDDCNVYVVPVPYFEKDSSGTYQSMCYEGDLFPEEVPIVSWENYQIKERRPEIVFIHNPYDNANRVTSIHLDFYAKELRNDAQMLVYVPYFVAGEDTYQSFCVCAGTIYADKVIVQSETTRKAYIRYFKEFVHDNRLEQLFPNQLIEEKFLALGSPKIDKAVAGQKKNCALPDDWERKLRGKKAILYNTGISGILNGNDQVLRKISDVIETFRYRDDVVLWWRPHPLSADTYGSMRPRLRMEYDRLIEQFKNEDVGIYDDSADLYRAITYTDMYYGDESSLIYLYGVQGKPIMFQNRNLILNENRKSTIYFRCFTNEGDTVWFVSNNDNRLFEMNINSGKIQCLAQIPREEDTEQGLYGKIFKTGDDLWLIPCKASELARYSLRDQKIKKYKLPGTGQEKPQALQHASLVDQKIYMVEGNYRRIVIFDIEQEKLTVDDKWWTDIRDTLEGRTFRFNAFSNVCKRGDNLYFTVNDTNAVIEYSLQKHCAKSYEIGSKDNQYSDILFDGKNFWLIPYIAGNIVRWNKEQEKVSEITEYPNDFHHNRWFESSCYKDGLIWLFPANGNMILNIDINTMEVRTAFHLKMDNTFCFARFLDKHRMVTSRVACNGENRLLVFDLNTGDQSEMTVEEPKNCRQRADLFGQFGHRNYERQKDYILMESERINIKAACEQIGGIGILEKEKNCFLQKYANADGSAGSKIVEKTIECYRRKVHDTSK